MNENEYFSWYEKAFGFVNHSSVLRLLHYDGIGYKTFGKLFDLLFFNKLNPCS